MRFCFKHRLADQNGSTFIEIIISLSLMSILILSVLAVLVFNMQIISSGKSRAIAMGLANEKLENLRNLPYDNLATVNGPIYPAGNIVDDEDVTVNGIKMVVHTDIDYVDDQFDGNFDGTVNGKPQDFYPYDYKKITVTVRLKSDNRKLADISTNVAGKVAETATNTGIILVKVIDANGNPVNDATVQLTNNNPNPAVNITTSTDSQGQVLIPKMPPDSSQGYHLVVSKAGYSSDQTYPANGATPVPTQPDFNVQAQQVITQTMAIDQLANVLTIKAIDVNGNPISGVNLNVHGQKTINSSPTVYKFTSTKTTNSNGEISFTALEWDSYDVEASNYTIVACAPYKPFTLNPAASLSVTLTLDSSPTTRPIIKTVTPNSASSGNSAVQVDIGGDNLNSSTTFLMRRAGHADIVASGITMPDGNTVSGTLDLTGAEAGYWDVVVSKGGQSTVQSGGFNVTN